MLRFLLIVVFVSTVYSAVAFTDDKPKEDTKIDFDPDWTPRPVAGDVPWYMKETDEDWLDDRLRKVDTGRTWNATFRYAESGITPNPDDKADGESKPKPAPTHRSFKGTAVRIGEQGDAGVIFDRNQCRVACGWTGEFLWHKDRRFGLLNTPQPAGDVVFATSTGAGWSRPRGDWEEPPAATAPLPRDWAHFEGMNRHGPRTVFVYKLGETLVLDAPWMEYHAGVELFTRTLVVYPHQDVRQVLVCQTQGREVQQQGIAAAPVLSMTDAAGTLGVALIGDPQECLLKADDDERIVVELPPSELPQVIKIGIARAEGLSEEKFGKTVVASPQATIGDVVELTEPGPPSWPQVLNTEGKVAEDDGPLVVDTLTVPYDNPYNALFFVSGVDFLPTGELAVSTVHGDVWLVTGVDDTLKKIGWKRFATGLYQPLGLKVVNRMIHILERGQLTRLHDLNNDGEADVYEAVNGDWHVGGGEHSFDTCLETDLEGNWYFHTAGDTHTPTGGTVMKVAADGSTSEIFCTGFRHPIGMGVLPDGRITGADQEGNWMPSTRIDIYQKGGFYGDMRAHHRDVPPETYNEPLCWLPRQMDGSAGGQFMVPDGVWGPLGGRMLHLSYGKCRMMLLMMQRVGDIEQAGAVDLGVQFIAGVQRGGFRPSDGHLYLVGMDGWQTAAVVDGCLQRVRYTGQPFRIPLRMAVRPTGLFLSFSESLNRDIAGKAERYHLEQWNYHWTAEYGSPRFSVTNPDEEGQDELPIESVHVRDNGREVFLIVPGLQPVMQMQIEYRLEDASGEPIEGVIYNTIHTTSE